MNSHNQHNENTPDKRQADASQLSEEQQALLTAEALGQLEPGSADAAKAAEIRSGQHRSEAEQLAADTTKIADALQSAATQETASLADDPARKEVRQAVLAAIAKNGSIAPATSTDTAAQRKKTSRRLVRWLSGLASLAAVIAVIVVMQPDVLQQARIEKALVDQANELSSEIAMVPAEGRNRSRRGAQMEHDFADEQQKAMPAAQRRADGVQAERSAGLAGDMVASDTMARQSGVKVGGGAIAGADKRAAPLNATAAAPMPTRVPTQGYQASKGELEMSGPASTLSERPTMALNNSLAVTEPRSLSRSRAMKKSKTRVIESEDMSFGREMPGRELSERHVRPNRETYAAISENPLRDPMREPLSTFSVDVDTASYANVRRFLNSGRRPPKNAVRIEELINYFSYDDPAPAGDDPFAVSLEAAASPWHVATPATPPAGACPHLDR